MACTGAFGTAVAGRDIRNAAFKDSPFKQFIIALRGGEKQKQVTLSGECLLYH